jgi:uncharacterized SAM-binding protein YcdF (DUF218 family)
MPFFLRKIVEALLLPIGISGLLTIAGVVFRRRWIAIVGVATLYAFSTQAVAKLMMRPLERVYEPMTVAAAPEADAIVVLSGGILRGVAPPGVQWGESANRYFAGIDLALADKAKIIIISTGSSLPEGALLRQIAILRGVTPQRIILTPRVLTTAEEARAVSEIPGIHSILLVTSASHMPRAVLLFRSHRLDVSPFPTDGRVLGGGRMAAWAKFTPDSEALRESELAMREYYGLAVYRTGFFFRPPAPAR